MINKQSLYLKKFFLLATNHQASTSQTIGTYIKKQQSSLDTTF